MIKPLQLPLRAMEKRHLLWWLRYHLSPLFRGALWVLSIVPHDYTGKHREAYSPPE